MTRSKRPADDPQSQAFIAAKRQREAESKQAQVRAREELLASAAEPGDHPNVLVVKRDEKAAKAEQERLDVAAAAAAKQSPTPPPDLPPTSGTLEPEHVPAHPLEPGPEGSAPFDPATPAGPMGEPVVHPTGDIGPDGKPLIQPGTAPVVPEYDGARDRTIKLRGPVDVEIVADEPLINRHSEEGAKIDAMKTGQRVVYVPNDAMLDPVSNDPARRD